MTTNPTASTATQKTVANRESKLRPAFLGRRSTSGPITPGLSSAGFNFSSSSRAPTVELDDTMNREVEDFSAVISRKENPKDVTSLLGLRDVLRHRRSFDNNTLTKGSGPNGSGSTRLAPRGAWAKPDVQVSIHNAGGEVTATAALSTLKSSSEAMAAAAILSMPSTMVSSSDEVATTADSKTSLEPNTEPSALAPPQRQKSRTIVSAESNHVLEPSTADVSTIESTDSSTQHTRTIASTFTTALRYMNVMAPSTPSASSGLPGTADSAYDDVVYRLALLGLEQGASFPKIDNRPHLQYDFTVGNRLRFSCTSYYALQFSHLRRQCGVEETLMRSLERTNTWIAEGGKSKASFFKTSDDRFILKTLVTAWNVSDL